MPIHPFTAPIRSAASVTTRDRRASRSGFFASLLAALLAAALPGTLAAASAATKRPNVVFILADDLGWGDLRCYGNEAIPTRNLDQLARDGTLFTRFFVNAPVCSPSRAGFFTGIHPSRHGIHGHFSSTKENKERGMPDFLDPAVPNIASLLRAAGYATAHVGKWHLGGDHVDAPSIAQYGFDFVGSSERGADVNPQDPYYRARSSALFVDEALQFIRKSEGRPFYLQLWLLLPHATLNPTSEQLERFPAFSNPNIPFKSARTIYYSCVDEIDRQVGRFLGELEQLGLAKDTLIVFSSDNGPEDPHIRNAGHSAIGSPGPFRGRKRSLYDGGIRTPFIVRLPGRIPAGRIDETSLVSGIDFLPTVCRLAGIPVPAGLDLDGEDMSDVFLGGSRARARPLKWEWRFRVIGHPANRSPQLAIRDGDWTLLMNPDRSRVELYDFRRDPMQVDNLAAAHPEVVETLARQLLEWKSSLPPGPFEPEAGRNDYPWPSRR